MVSYPILPSYVCIHACGAAAGEAESSDGPRRGQGVFVAEQPAKMLKQSCGTAARDQTFTVGTTINKNNKPSIWEWLIPTIYGDDWGMVYYCYTRVQDFAYRMDFQEFPT